MTDVTIRKLEASDLPLVSNLLETRNELDKKSAEIRTELMEWIAFHNPARENGEATYYVVEDQNKIVAFHGRMPVWFNDRGKTKKGYYVHDLYVDPEYRKKGMGFWLTIAMAKEIEEKSDSVFCLLGMTPLNLKMQRRRGYHETETVGFGKILNPRKQLKKLLKSDLIVSILNPVVKLMFSFVDVILLSFINSKGVYEVKQFDDRFNELNQRLMEKTAISSVRDKDYLNWKYIDRPYPREKVLAVDRQGELKGFIIVGPSPYNKLMDSGRIVDLWADPEDQQTVRALLKAAIQYFKTIKSHQLTCVSSDPRFKKSFKRLLFLEKPGKTFMIGNLDKVDIDNERLKDIRNWHVTYGESDAYMLNT